MMYAFTFSRCTFVLLAFFLLVSTSNVVLATPVLVQDFDAPVIEIEMEAGQEGDDVDEDGDEDEVDEEDLVQNNPWGIDERKMKAAKLFWYQNAFRIEVQKIKMVCELDKKQALKLKIASKGAAKKELDVWLKKWNDQMKQFQGMNFGVGGPAQEQKKRKAKEIVINDADEIDDQTMQFLANSNMMFGGMEEEQKAVDSAFWKKTVKGILTPEQNEKYIGYLEARNAARVKAKIDAFVVRMQADLALTDEQMQKYDALVRPQMEKAPLAPGYYENFAFQYFATKYDKEKMKQVLDEDQYQMMKMILGPSKAYGAMFDQQNVGGNIVVGGVGVDIDMGGIVLEAVGEVVEEAAAGVADFIGEMMKSDGEQK